MDKGWGVEGSYIGTLKLRFTRGSWYYSLEMWANRTKLLFIKGCIFQMHLTQKTHIGLRLELYKWWGVEGSFTGTLKLHFITGSWYWSVKKSAMKTKRLFIKGCFFQMHITQKTQIGLLL